MQLGNAHIRRALALLYVRLQWGKKRETMSQPIQLELTFTYRNGLLAGLERDPRIAFYLSSDLGHQFQIIDPYAERPVVRFKLDAPASGQPFIAQDAALHIWQFATVDNDSGEPSTNEAGYAMVPLKLLLSNTKPVQLTQDLVVMNARNAQRGIDARKGQVSLVAAKTSFPHGRSPFLPPGRYDISAENEKFVVETLGKYIQSNNTIFQQKPSTYESVKYLHLPLWSFGAYSVGGSAFAVPRAEPSPESWWINASRMALRRHYQHLSLEEAEAQFLQESTGEAEVMTIVSKMHTAVVNHVATYLSDGIYVPSGVGGQSKPERQLRSTVVENAFCADLARTVRAKPIKARRLDAQQLVAGGAHANRSAQFVNMEAFTLGRMRVAAYKAKGADNSGDCEDDGAEICLQAMELKTLETTDPVLLKMRDVRQHYVVAQALLGVRGAQLSDAESSRRDAAHAELGGHMAAMYMAKEQLIQMHARYNTARPLYEGIAEPAPGTRAPTLSLEGTGLVDPIGSPEYAASVDAMRYLLAGSDRAFSRIKYIQPQSRSQLNAFYRVVQSFAVPDLADEYSSIEHVVLKKQNGRTSTGADYLEFINGDATLSTYAMPNMNEDEIMITKRILNQRFPILPYGAPTAPISSEPTRGTPLDSVSDFVGKLGRHAGECWVVDVYPRYTQVNAELAREWIRLIQSKERVVDFQYYEENLGPQTGGYLARFYIAK